MAEIPSSMRILTSEAKSNGTLEIKLSRVPTPKPGAGQVLVRVEAAPISPSDLALLIGLADVSQAQASGTEELPVVSLPVPEFAMPMMAGRLDRAMPVGNEGAGLVVAAGSPEGEALIGRRVATAGSEMFAEYRAVPVSMCMPLPAGVDARDGASSFVNPMTALSMIGVMKRDGSPALVHTAAASNLGQMLQRICRADGIPLVNIVRRPEQQAILRELGADHALNSKDSDFMGQLIAACAATEATVGFDAVGGGILAGQIVTAMEMVQVGKMTEFSRYGSSVHKQVYVYGRLDVRPTTVPASVGMAWGVGGFLLPTYLQSITPETRMGMIGRVLAELTTTFASSYSAEISLQDALNPDIMARYNARKTGEKYLIRPGE